MQMGIKQAKISRHELIDTTNRLLLKHRDAGNLYGMIVQTSGITAFKKTTGGGMFLLLIAGPPGAGRKLAGALSAMIVRRVLCAILRHI